MLLYLPYIRLGWKRRGHNAFGAVHFLSASSDLWVKIHILSHTTRVSDGCVRQPVVSGPTAAIFCSARICARLSNGR